MYVVVYVVILKMTVWSMTIKYKTTAEWKDFGGLQKMFYVLCAKMRKRIDICLVRKFLGENKSVTKLT